jgi:hypothetical protein
MERQNSDKEHIQTRESMIESRRDPPRHMMYLPCVPVREDDPDGGGGGGGWFGNPELDPGGPEAGRPLGSVVCDLW